MQKTNIFIIKFKRNLIPILLIYFIFCLVFFSNSNLPAVKNGLNLFFNSVIPSLLPFFIATQMLMHTNIVNQIGKVLNPITKLLFNVRRPRGLCFYNGYYFWISYWSKNCSRL